VVAVMNKNCSNCGHELLYDTIVCDLCGEQLVESTNHIEIDRHLYLSAMAENLSLLRSKLELTQAELADLIGVSRQTIATAETGVREMSWSTFLSLCFLFRHNNQTNVLLPVLGIFTPELSDMFNAAFFAKQK
jgi:DNA-binding XRE family transcriptional regulator